MGGDLVRSEADMSATSARGPGTQILAAPSLFFDIKKVSRVGVCAGSGSKTQSDLNGEGAGGAARGQSSVGGCHRQSVLSPFRVAERG